MRLGALLLLAIFTGGLSASDPAIAADMKDPARLYVQKKPPKRVVAELDCRTGWWMAQCNGVSCPTWATRCR